MYLGNRWKLHGELLLESDITPSQFNDKIAFKVNFSWLQNTSLANRAYELPHMYLTEEKITFSSRILL